jgi:hypothetical protein
MRPREFEDGSIDPESNRDLKTPSKSPVRSRFKYRLLVALLLQPLFALNALAFGPASEAELKFEPTSEIKIMGDSTVRKYSAQTKEARLTGQARQVESPAGTKTWLPERIEMVMNVADLKSGNGTLDEHMHKALKANEHPTITLKITSTPEQQDKWSDGQSLKAIGELTVSGSKQPIELEAALSKDGEKFRIQGKKKLLMSSFGIQPPTLMLGALKTKDEIEVTYDLIFSVNQTTGAKQ